MRKTTTLLASLLICLTGLTPAAHAQSRGGRARGAPGTGDPSLRLVPWKFLAHGAPLAAGPLALYWIPSSLAETEHSPLMTSDVLIEASTRCVSMRIILPDDPSLLDRLGLTGKVPAAVLVNASGGVISRAENAGGLLRPRDVEQLVDNELRVRDDAMLQAMKSARQDAAADERESAVALYRKIWDDRCLFPLAGHEAQQALKDLGVTVIDVPAPPPPDPNLQPGMPSTTTAPPVMPKKP